MINNFEKFTRNNERRYDMEMLVGNLLKAEIINEETTVRVISRIDRQASDFNLPAEENAQRWLDATMSWVYSFSYDVDEDLLILEVE